MNADRCPACGSPLITLALRQHFDRHQEREEKHPFLFALTLVLCFALGFLMGCAPRPVESTPPEPFQPAVVFAQTLTVTVIDPGTGWHGGVACERGVPVIQYMGKYHPRTGQLLPPGSPLRAESVRHEAMHFVQLAADGDCTQTARRWIANPLEWLDAEAQALCAGLEVYRGPAWTVRKAELFALLMSWHNGWDGAQAENAMGRWCDGGVK